MSRTKSGPSPRSQKSGGANGKVARGAGYTFYSRGKWHVNPPITHPALCVCDGCKRRRENDEWGHECVIQIDRVSPFSTREQSIGYAFELKRTEEERLRQMTEEAIVTRKALAMRKSFGEICDAYRQYQREQGRRIDKDHFRIDLLEEYFGIDRDSLSITRADVREFRGWLLNERRVSLTTVDRYLNTFLAIMNGGVKDGLIDSHQLSGMRRNRRRSTGRPRTLTPVQVAVLLGEAMDQFEAEQVRQRQEKLAYSTVPLRGLCLIAYKTLLRPTNNFCLRWEDLRIDERRREATFFVSEHKNVKQGISLEGPIAPTLLTYLLSRRPKGVVHDWIHANPHTGKPFTNIRVPWTRLITIANELLEGKDQIVMPVKFYVWRATGASSLAASGADPVLITKLMGDASLSTVLRHYFDSSIRRMQHVVAAWDCIADA